MSFRDIDKTNMRSMVESFPIMLGAVTLPTELGESISIIKRTNISGVCLIGMGGSAIAGALCRDYLYDKLEVPIEVVNNYDLPSYVSRTWIVIATSYSGNTEETLSALQEAKDRGCHSICITSGGKMLQMCDLPFIARLPTGFQPRATLPILFTVLYRILEMIFELESLNLVQIQRELITKQSEWEDGDLSPAKIAGKIIGKIPLFIGTHIFNSVAYRAKCQVNENAKYLAFYSVLPEANHNEIESLGGMSEAQIIPIFIRSMNESERVAKRIEATSRIFEDEVEECLHLKLEASSQIIEMLQLVFFLDYVSLELAESLDVDPVKVDRIMKLKKILSND